MLQSVERVQRHSTGNGKVFVFKEVAAALDVVAMCDLDILCSGG